MVTFNRNILKVLMVGALFVLMGSDVECDREYDYFYDSMGGYFYDDYDDYYDDDYYDDGYYYDDYAYYDDYYYDPYCYCY